MRFVKPLDDALILQLAADHDVLVTLEENAIMGGAGSGVNELLMAHRVWFRCWNIGLPDFFIPQGTREKCAPTSALMPVSKPKSPPGWPELPLTAPMLKGYPLC
jgi:deoxyxylulose-5-phosphate synthase